MDRASDGTFWVAWQQNPDKEGDDIFLRHLDADLKPMGAEVRATDYEPEKGKSPQVSAAEHRRVERERFRRVCARAGQAAPHRAHAHPPRVAGPGDGPAGRLEDEPASSARRRVSNEDKVGGDYPSIACTKDACFLVWHEIEKGAQAALIDPVKGTMLWRKRFAPRGGHPAVATPADGPPRSRTTSRDASASPPFRATASARRARSPR